jgi:hypothetical protein
MGPAMTHGPAQRARNTSLLDLNCLVLGHGRNRIFDVQISDSEKVSALKTAICGANPNFFRHVDANTLDIFKVSFPDNDNLPAECGYFQHQLDSGKVRHENSTDELKEVFLHPLVDKHVHVIILCPPDGEYALVVGIFHLAFSFSALLISISHSSPIRQAPFKTPSHK